jgi:hypothetical protein
MAAEGRKRTGLIADRYGHRPLHHQVPPHGRGVNVGTVLAGTCRFRPDSGAEPEPGAADWRRGRTTT